MRDILDPQDRWLGTPGGFLSFGNKAPVAIDDALEVGLGSGPVSVDVLANDYDPEGQILTLVSASAALGTAVAEADNTVTYSPPSFSGSDTIVYEIADDLDQRRTGQVDVTITEETFALTVHADNTMSVEAGSGVIDLTIAEPSAFAGAYTVDISDLASGPVNLVPPSVTGTFAAGEVLSASPGLWLHDTTEAPVVRSWQWRSGGADIPGATADTYTVQVGDIGQLMTVAEVQTDEAGQREATAEVPGSQVFQPGDDAGLLGWWDASDAATITESGGAVSSWADKASAGSLIQTNGPLQPMTGTRVLNGRNVLDFNGTQFLAEAARALPASGDVAFHMALVIDSTSNAFEAVLAVDASNDFQLDAANAGQFNGQLNVAGIGSSLALSGGPFSGGLIFSLIFDRTGSATAEVFVSDVSRGSTGYTAPIDANVALNVMANRSLNARVDGAFAELLVTSTLTNRSDYHAYLATKWGLV